MFTHKKFDVIVIALLLQSASIAGEATVVERCIEGISKIQSYDVNYGLETLDYPNLATPDKASLPDSIQVVKKRDVIAFGVGRRFEDFVGTDNQMITVMDWRTAGLREKRSPAVKTAAAISSFAGAPGDSYLEFFNPDISGFFLADLLRDKESAIQMLDKSTAPAGLIGFAVKHPQVPEPVQVWVDPNHGYMPSLIETFFINKNGQRELDERTQVKEFVQISDGVWVPVKGTHDNLLASGLNTGKTYSGTSLVVDVQKSSWNSIKSGELFTEASMPPVNNNVNEDGFKRHYPPAMLTQMNEAKQQMNNAIADALAKSKPLRFTLILINVLVVILLAAIFVWRRYHRHPAV